MLCSKKKNNLDELSNIPIKAEERSNIQISFRTQEHQDRVVRHICIRCIGKITKCGVGHAVGHRVGHSFVYTRKLERLILVLAYCTSD